MQILALVTLLAAAVEAPRVEVSCLNGDAYTGQLQQITPAALRLQTESGERELPLAELLDVRVTPAQGQSPNAAGDGPALAQVALLDGSRMRYSKIQVSGGKAQLDSPLLGTLALPMTAVANIRFDATGDQLDSAWSELCGRPLKTDLVAVRKQREEGDVLDHLSGVVGEIDGGEIKFLLDSEEIPIKREKVFGIVYYRRDPQVAPSFCRMQLSGGDVVEVRSLSYDGGTVRAALVAGADVEFPADVVRSLDFSQSKVRYLSKMEPRDVKYTPPFHLLDTPSLMKFWPDRTRDGGLLTLGTKSYPRGLWIRSKTSLRYRIGGEYRRFLAVMGIDADGAPQGDVRVVISGDGKPLFESEVRGSDEPREIDVDVSGVRDLEILVDFISEQDPGTCDFLDLADARVVK